MLRYITGLLNMTEDEIVNHPDLLVNVFDHDHYILFWNKQCEQLFGVREEQALGKKLEDIIPFTPNSSKMKRLEEAPSGETVYIEDDKIDHNDDYYYSQVVLPIKNSMGKVIAALNIVRKMSAKDPSVIRENFSVFPDQHKDTQDRGTASTK
jgi:PAS domain S-box-containing protein